MTTPSAAQPPVVSLDRSPRPAPATLVAIASAGHSGSTLLDVLLANHSHISSAGEMNRLTLHAQDRICACGATVTSCEYWNRVRASITESQHRERLIRWDDCHTDIPPEKPLCRLLLPEHLRLVDDAAPPSIVLDGLRAHGLAVSDAAVLARGGVRDFKWRLIDAQTNRNYVLRCADDRLDVYAEVVEWKNPLRRMPQPLELALALGSRRSLGVLRRFSAHAAEYTTIAENSWAVVDGMAAVGGTPFVLDSSKSPVRLKLLYLYRPNRARVVHLVRDGRAVAASAMRRTKVSSTVAARVWKRDNQNIAIMLRTIPDKDKLHVKYEALCENPGSTLQRICDFLGLAFEPGMVTLWQRPVHNIPGNPMLFNRSQRTIVHDERWRRDLVASDLETFERIAGRLNRSLGYR